MPNSSEKSDPQNIQVTVVLWYNGTYGVQSADPALKIAEIVLLGLVFLISFCGNLFLFVTIASSYSLRGETFNRVLVYFCGIHLIETVVNMPLGLLYVTMGPQTLESWVCCVNSFSVQLVLVELPFGLCMGSLESTLQVKHLYDFQQRWTAPKQAVALLTLWVAGILLCSPLLLGSIPSDVCPARYGCSFRGPDGFVYMLFISIWCNGLILLIGICCLAHLAKQRYEEYNAHGRKRGLNSSEVFLPGGMWTEWINVQLMACLTLLYFGLELPFIVIHYKTGFMQQPFKNLTTLETPPPKYETVFTWFKYLHSCFFAFFVFKIRKDIRYKFQTLLHCCRPNVVRDHSAVPVLKEKNKKKGPRKDSIQPISFSTPVLYISPEGLCLRQLAPSAKPFLNYAPDDKVNQLPSFVSYFCDVNSSPFAGEYSNISDERFAKIYSKIFQEDNKMGESEASLNEFSARESDGSESLDIPVKDLDSLLLKPADQPAQRKTVRFAETLTFYKTLTPQPDTPTPKWVINSAQPKDKFTKIRNRHSKIPTRIQSRIATSPWKLRNDEQTFERVRNAENLNTAGEEFNK